MIVAGEMYLVQMDDNTHLIAVVPQCQADPLRLRLGTTGVVRWWGTTKGRGQLCLEGPQEKTIVDLEPEGGLISWLHIRRAIPVTPQAASKWLSLLEKKK